MPTTTTDQNQRRSKPASRLISIRSMFLDMRSDQRIFATVVKKRNNDHPRTPSTNPLRGEKGDGPTPLAAGRTFEPNTQAGFRRSDIR